MTREHADLLNRIGMGLNFVSFWCVTPEFIGKDQLKSWERAIENFLRMMPPILKKTLWMFLVVSGAFVALRYEEKRRTGHMVTPGLPQGWPIALMVLMVLYLAFQTFGLSLLSKLEEDDDARRKSMVIGAVFFTLGSLMQFFAT